MGGKEKRGVKIVMQEESQDGGLDVALLLKAFGSSRLKVASIPVAEYPGHPLGDHASVKNGRPPDALLTPRKPIDASIVRNKIIFPLQSSKVFVSLVTRCQGSWLIVE